jgi:hypothetical protein
MDDGAANTGCTGDLWKLLKDYGLITVWCLYYWSDLPAESAVEVVPEVK